MYKNKKKMEAAWRKAKALEEGRKQFDYLPHAEQSAYVWAGNVIMPVCMKAGR